MTTQQSRPPADWDVHSLLEMAGDAIFVANLQGHFHYVNPAAVRLLGWTQAEFLRMTLGDLIPEEQKPAMLRSRSRSPPCCARAMPCAKAG